MLVSVDDVVTGLLVNVISATGRWLGTAAAGAARPGRGRDGEAVTVARWFETYKLTERTPDLPGLSNRATEQLRLVLSGDEAQAAIQELLAVRLTDGPNEDAARARAAFTIALAVTGDPDILACANVLADYYDAEISDLVGLLDDSPLLAQIRSEALSARMIAVLHAIERHTLALSGRPTARTEADFLKRYQAHILDQHGKLEPPDFDRRRRVPIADIYVPTVIYEEIYSEMALHPDVKEPPSLTVWELADRLDRTVLLGDPGGGKTTASTVLMHHFASETERKVPFLVTLRKFASEDPPARSVVGFIEHELETLYQCEAPSGLVELLLLTGRAVVIFDGLDELLDTARRADVSTRVERFCAEYPLAPVLVTSRFVGYDQARLDDTQFTCHRLGGFRDEEVAEYTRKWFALDEGSHPEDADALMSESESIPDLRGNPLILSLLCILYRGEGSLPRNRAEVYEQCANLLFRRWDARRRIHQELRAGHLVEPALRHLAWWLFTRADAQTAVTERELIAATTKFLQSRGFESQDDARQAAQEFVEFSRGRMWVFSDAGTTSSGEKLYAFTHRTFMEYFAAGQLAFDNDTAEKLAITLLPHIARGEWEVVGELAIQIKDSTSINGATRVYEYLLKERRYRSEISRRNIIKFLARSVRSVTPSARVSRELAVEALKFAFGIDPKERKNYSPLAWLLGGCDANLDAVESEVSDWIDVMVNSNNTEDQIKGIFLAVYLNDYVDFIDDQGPVVYRETRIRRHWADKASAYRLIYAARLVELSAHRRDVRNTAVRLRVLTVGDAVKMDGGLQPLLSEQPYTLFGAIWFPYLQNMVGLLISRPNEDRINDMRAVAQYLTDHKGTPWTARPISGYSFDKVGESPDALTAAPDVYLGAAAVILMSVEASPSNYDSIHDPDPLGQFSELHRYIERRLHLSPIDLLPDLPVPSEFKQVFRQWAEGDVNFLELG